jgi:hypothetical protein
LSSLSCSPRLVSNTPPTWSRVLSTVSVAPTVRSWRSCRSSPRAARCGCRRGSTGPRPPASGR